MDYFAIHPGGREFPDFREILKRRKRKVFPVAVDKRFMGNYRGTWCLFVLTPEGNEEIGNQHAIFAWSKICRITIYGEILD